jgi:hypothetical protein
LIAGEEARRVEFTKSPARRAAIKNAMRAVVRFILVFEVGKKRETSKMDFWNPTKCIVLPWNLIINQCIYLI